MKFCNFTSNLINSSSLVGGIVTAASSMISFEDCFFTDNLFETNPSAPPVFEGTIASKNTKMFTLKRVHIVNSKLSGDFAPTKNFNGIGISIFTGSLLMVDSSISFCTSESAFVHGYGIYMSLANVTLQNVQIINNGNDNTQQSNSGGGIHVESGNLVCDNCVIANNHAYFGGAIFSRGDLLLNNSRISKNTAHVAGVYCAGLCDIANSFFNDQSTNILEGSGVSCMECRHAKLQNSTFVQSTLLARSLLLLEPTVIVEKCHFIDETAFHNSILTLQNVNCSIKNSKIDSPTLTPVNAQGSTMLIEDLTFLQDSVVLIDRGSVLYCDYGEMENTTFGVKGTSVVYLTGNCRASVTVEELSQLNASEGSSVVKLRVLGGKVFTEVLSCDYLQIFGGEFTGTISVSDHFTLAPQQNAYFNGVLELAGTSLFGEYSQIFLSPTSAIYNYGTVFLDTGSRILASQDSSFPVFENQHIMTTKDFSMVGNFISGHNSILKVFWNSSLIRVKGNATSPPTVELIAEKGELFWTTKLFIDAGNVIGNASIFSYNQIDFTAEKGVLTVLSMF